MSRLFELGTVCIPYASGATQETAHLLIDVPGIVVLRCLHDDGLLCHSQRYEFRSADRDGGPRRLHLVGRVLG